MAKIERLCVFNQLPSEKDTIKVRLPYHTDGSVLEFAQGDVLVAEDLITDGGADNFDVYQGKLVTDISEEPAIIFNQGVYEDEFGNRPDYVVNPGYIRYKSGEIITMVRPSKNIKLQISDSSITGTATVKEYLIPQVANEDDPKTFGLKANASNVGAGVSYKVEKADETMAIGHHWIKMPLVRTM